MHKCSVSASPNAFETKSHADESRVYILIGPSVVPTGRTYIPHLFPIYSFVHLIIQY